MIESRRMSLSAYGEGRPLRNLSWVPSLPQYLGQDSFLKSTSKGASTSWKGRWIGSCALWSPWRYELKEGVRGLSLGELSQATEGNNTGGEEFDPVLWIGLRGSSMHFEHQALDSATHKPSHFFRYVDDTFVVWPHGQDKLQEFLQHLNSIHANIQFTMEVESEGSLPFLDIHIHRKADVAQHSIEKEHKILFDHTKVINKSSHYWDRTIKEAIEIKLEKNNFNRDSGLQLSQAWTPALDQLRPSYNQGHEDYGPRTATDSNRRNRARRPPNFTQQSREGRSLRAMTIPGPGLADPPTNPVSPETATSI
ncbi:hypothetical protein ANN_17831 [Periplaneta americana]|uniref:Reverse transcriptase domain-containing protein n=1 Tax=Periplaneta americana TaxID=6978 RepID=A0ABQ8SVD5_PERAM|nr:hypothetical protein ANN_17831 [Periplaneta americana]